MIEKADFQELVRLAMAEPGLQNMRQVIEKELLHANILFALEREGLLDRLTFQGGASLRLCRGASRFSEDLDFAGDRDFASQDVARIKECVEDYVCKRYQLDVIVKEPRELRCDPDYAAIKVDKWQVAVVTAPASRVITRQCIKLKIANVPAYAREARSLNINYPFLPDGYRDFLIVVKTPDEVMADKLVALPNATGRVRHYDIWDLQWLKQQGATPNMNLVQQKLADYSVENYIGKARSMQRRLPEIVNGTEFKNEMTRSLPTMVLDRTINQSKFAGYLCNENQALLGQVIETMGKTILSGPKFEFNM